MKMKFRYLVNSAMLWTALALGSCADFLDREPYSEPVDESYWNSEEDVEAAVAGGYGFRTVDNYATASRADRFHWQQSHNPV